MEERTVFLGEASDGLDPRSSQGFVEIQRCEALALARAGQIRPPERF